MFQRLQKRREQIVEIALKVASYCPHVTDWRGAEGTPCKHQAQIIYNLHFVGGKTEWGKGGGWNGEITCRGTKWEIGEDLEH